MSTTPPTSPNGSPTAPNGLSIRSMDTVTTQISGTQTIKDNAGKDQFTLFVIYVTCGDLAWSVSRRFSEFESMHSILKEHTSALPALPAKTWLRTFLSDFLEKRKSELDSYLRDLLKVPFARYSTELVRFLDIPKHFQPDLSSVPRVYQTITDTNYGVNDVVYAPQDGLLLTGCEDADLLSRFDAAMSSIKMPWEKEHPQKVPLGSLNCWVHDQKVSVFFCGFCCFY